MTNPLRIALCAELGPDTNYGGVESVLVGLISALGKLTDGPEEYVITTPAKAPDWLRNYVGPNQRMVSRPTPPAATPRHPLAARMLGSVYEGLGAAKRRLRKPADIVATPSPWTQIPLSNGFYESLGCDVLHFPYQTFTLCSIPTVFNPHDLQHRHMPSLFSPQLIADRESLYRQACGLSHTVVVASDWTKNDLIFHYGLHPDKIQTIPWASPTQALADPSEGDLASVGEKYGLRPPYALYPAVMWPHKNHVRLLEALAWLRDRDNLDVRLVCTGKRRENVWTRIESRLRELRLEDRVQFLGHISREDLRAVYRMAQFVVVPTLFEAASGPMYEAWLEGRAVACSTVTSLPEQAADAALLFDPYSVEAIAAAIKRLATEPDLREDLERKGRCRLADFTWDRTARAYRAVYRRAARVPLNDEDRLLLAWDWMKDREPPKDLTR
ncbi:glycosyltransferase [Candidatus Sumerlaeota bacterium]|nr:glycosyltransferase [Candidatus Sumerlaeota bacterium]